MESISTLSNHRTPTNQSVAQSSFHSKEIDWKEEEKKVKDLIKVYSDHSALPTTEVHGKKSKLRKALSWDTIQKIKKIFKGSTFMNFKSPSPRKKNTK